MKYLIQISIILLFTTSLAYFAWKETDSKFFEELFYFGFKPCLLSSFIVYKKHYPELSFYISLAIIQVVVSIIWEIYAAFNWNGANRDGIIAILFSITVILIFSGLFKSYFSNIKNGKNVKPNKNKPKP